MAKPKNLAMMSLDALVKLRDDVTEMLGNQAVAIEEQLARLAELGPSGNSGRARERSPLRARKVPVKYRDKNGNTWSGRGAQPRWMTAAIKAGAKRDDFLVRETSKNSAKKAKKSAKKARPAKKAKPAKRSTKRSTKRAKPVQRAKRPIARPKVKASKPAKRSSARPRAKVQSVQQVKRVIPQPQPNVDVSPAAASPSS